LRRYILVDRRKARYREEDGVTFRAPDAKLGKFFVYNRPHMAEFVEWAFEHFTAGTYTCPLFSST